jgi:hypothetical protein
MVKASTWKRARRVFGHLPKTQWNRGTMFRVRFGDLPRTRASRAGKLEYLANRQSNFLSRDLFEKIAWRQGIKKFPPAALVK